MNEAREQATSALSDYPLTADTEKLSQEELKDAADKAFEYIEAFKQVEKLPYYPKAITKDEIRKIRFFLVLKIFRESATQVLAEQGKEANFIGASLSPCDVDYELMNQIIKRTFQEIRRVADDENA